MRHLLVLVAVLLCCTASTTLEAQSIDRLAVAADLHAASGQVQRGSPALADLRSAFADDSLSEHHWERYALIGAVAGGVATAVLVAGNSSLPGCGASGNATFCAGARLLVVGAGTGVGALGGWLVARLMP
jgi:hypothetical protein